MKRYWPKQHTVYTFKQICEELDLRDSPSLGFRVKGSKGQTLYGAVQNAHCTEAQLLAVPGWAESKWKYRYETDEWIPVFEYAAGDITALVDLETYWNSLFDREKVWATPKTLPRKRVDYSLD